MDKLNLSLRQRKLLHMMQEQTTYITGNELAKQLGVSPRTIRSDIVEINQNILPYHAKILSARSKGYLYTAENPEIIQQLNHKKLIALLLAAVMCLSLAACDNGKTENTDHSQGQNTENTSKENQQTETASQGNGNPEC